MLLVDGSCSCISFHENGLDDFVNVLAFGIAYNQIAMYEDWRSREYGLLLFGFCLECEQHSNRKPKQLTFVTQLRTDFGTPPFIRQW